MKTLAVLTSGGDAPGMNPAIRAFVKVAAARGVRVVGVENGYDGLIDGTFRELTLPCPAAPGALSATPDADFLGNTGGTALGTARSPRFRTPEGRTQAIERLGRIDGLLVIGGDGSLTGAHLLARSCDTPVLGLPASIDNDVGCTGTALGVDTALNTIVDACDRVCDTAISHRRAFVVEVMGRHSGYLAMASAIAAGADAVLFREQGRSEHAIVEAVSGTIRRAFAADRKKRRVLILKAEGVEIPCTRLVRLVEEKLSADGGGYEVRATVLGHLVRGGRPSFQDRMIASRLAFAAASALLEGATDQMVAWQSPVEGGTPTDDPVVQLFPLDRVLSETAALLDGTSALTRWRVQMLERVEGALSL